MRTSLTFLFAVLYALSSTAQSDGVRDYSFDTDGIVLTTVTPAQRNTIHKLLEQPDGKIIAIGTTNEYSTDGNIALVRYNSNGSPDNSFGVNGIVTFNAGGWSGGTTGMLLSNGKIVVAGFKNQGIAGSRAIVLRFNANGTLDNTYDGDGILEIGPATGTLNGFYDMEKDVSGSFYLSASLDNGSGNADIAVVKLTAALAVDNSFGIMGIAQFPTDAGADNSPFAISIQGDAKIVGAGLTQQGGGQKGFLFRLQINGLLDNSFAGTGWFHNTDVNSFNDIGIQSNGRIVGAAFRYSFGSLLLMRTYDTDGIPVPGTDVSISNRIGFKLMMQNDDRYLVTGTDGGSIVFSTARFNALGMPEDLDLNPASLNDVVTDITPVQEYAVTGMILSNGKYLVAGLAGVSGSPGSWQFAMVRYFGTSGEINLPVGLVDFSAAPHDQQVKLSWSTAFEQNNKGFEIQRSSDAINFSVIGWVAGAINSNSIIDYQFIDAAPVKGKNYYRLRQVDLDGKNKLSAVRHVVFTAKNEWIIYPNPVRNKLTLQFDNSSRRKITISDIQGKICLVQQNASEAIIRIPVNQLPAGIYTIQVADITGKIEVRKFIIKD